MSRPGITLEEVRNAAHAIVAEGRLPTTRNIRERLGTGGMGTITRHLAALRNEQPQTTVPASPEFESELADILSRERRRITEATRSQIEQELATVRAETLDLAQSLEKAEGELAEAKQQLIDLARERDGLSAVNGERAGEIKRLQAELKEERLAGETAKANWAAATQKTKDQEELLKEQREGLVKLRGSLHECERAKAAAEQAAAVAEAEKKAAIARASDAERYAGPKQR